MSSRTEYSGLAPYGSELDLQLERGSASKSVRFAIGYYKIRR